MVLYEFSSPIFRNTQFLLSRRRNYFRRSNFLKLCINLAHRILCKNEKNNRPQQSCLVHLLQTKSGPYIHLINRAHKGMGNYILFIALLHYKSHTIT